MRAHAAFVCVCREGFRVAFREWKRERAHRLRAGRDAHQTGNVPGEFVPVLRGLVSILVRNVPGYLQVGILTCRCGNCWCLVVQLYYPSNTASVPDSQECYAHVSVFSRVELTVVCISVAGLQRRMC